ncbi:MAG: V-type ATP synthase subunit K [Acholeplasmatales bacterium]|jgi:V/A-type H+-transporting ATPase subunit K|nr:V-type ATP synthase subunit K [Acholeplasmataceae bacterium]MDY0114899.1 V-type ATP synthase subunit K [Acholeplasmatales bacterium]MCK9234219.1 V-type ATP synthase subunit K [Acholeplasmataceae bacterium]MCK9289256.1 V-type ATP synthase subunit K [Acholeplasmataceae bacterium]MCK9427160.1 V-type ATP synthase subunit K [Acholeplasmataceae bacterium]
MSFGLMMALFGVAIAAGFAGVGSAMGVGIAGKAASGVLAEKPELYGRTLLLQALPGTQGIYGFLIAVLLLNKIGLLGGEAATITATDGFAYLAAGLPIAITGLMSGIYQGKAAAAAILMTAKDASLSTRGMIMTALVETYAILGLLVSILVLFAI